MINKIKELLENNKDEIQATKMSSYMQDKFVFAGIPKPKLNELIKPIIKESSKESLDWKFIYNLWDNDFREAQYVGLEYLKKHHKQLVSKDIDKLKKLIVHKSWWDTVDSIDAFVGELVLNDENLKKVMLEWSQDKNIWLRRVSINYQQEYKLKTDVEMLEKIIKNNFGSDEFFINKAIGWSLRDYSKVNPKWVKAFINKYKNQMSQLSIKEASKYL